MITNRRNALKFIEANPLCSGRDLPQHLKYTLRSAEGRGMIKWHVKDQRSPQGWVITKEGLAELAKENKSC